MAMDRAAIARVSLVRAPLLTARTFALVVAEGAASLLTHASRHAVVCAAAAGAVATLVATVRSPPAGLEGTVALLVDQASFVAYWVTLGVLSSVGLGSGLHTFVLFLGPHILRVANAAVLHGNTGERAPGRGSRSLLSREASHRPLPPLGGRERGAGGRAR